MKATASKIESETSTLITICLAGLGSIKTEADMKCSFKLEKAWAAKK